MKKKIVEELSKVQELSDQNKITVSIKLSDKYVWLTYDEGLIYDARFKALQSKRILGIDMNPNYIGLSVIEFTRSGGKDAVPLGRHMRAGRNKN